MITRPTHRVLAVLALIALTAPLSPLLATWPPSSALANAQGAATFRLNPVGPTTVEPGELVTIEMVVDAGTWRIDGLNATVSFAPPEIFEVQDTGTTNPAQNCVGGINIDPGQVGSHNFEGETIANCANNTTGRITYSFLTFQNNVTGTFTLATITFRARPTAPCGSSAIVRYATPTSYSAGNNRVNGVPADVTPNFGDPVVISLTPCSPGAGATSTPGTLPSATSLPTSTVPPGITPFVSVTPTFLPGVPSFPTAVPTFVPGVNPFPTPVPLGTGQGSTITRNPSTAPIVNSLRPQAGAYSGDVAISATAYFPIVMRERNGLTTLLALQSRAESLASVQIIFSDSAGNQVGTHSLTLDPNGSSVIDPRTLPSLPSGFVGSAVVESSQPIASSVSQLRDGSDALAYSGFASGSERVFVPLLFKSYNGWNTGLQVQNLASSPAQVLVTYRRANGPGGPWQERQLVPPRSAVTFFQPANAELPDGFVGSAVVEGGTGAALVAVVNEVNRDGSGTSYEGAEVGRATVFAPLLFKNANGWNTGVQIQNVGDVATEVLATYRASDGSGEWSERQMVAPGDSATFYQPSLAELPNGFVGAGVFRSFNDQPLVGIVNEVNSARQVAMTYRALETGGETVSAPYLVRNVDGWSTGLQVQNLGTEATTVSVQLRQNSGSLDLMLRSQIPPGESRTFYLPAIDGLPDGWIGSGVVTAAPLQPLAAIVNETRY
jgi:hypothetical protein